MYKFAIAFLSVIGYTMKWVNKDGGNVFMKVFTTILKILAAIAVVAGLVYVFAAYGDKIAYWCKEAIAKIRSRIPCKRDEVAETDFEDCEGSAAETDDAVEADDLDFEG